MNRCLQCAGACQQGRYPCDCRPDPAECATELGADDEDAGALFEGCGPILWPAVTAVVAIVAWALFSAVWINW